MTEKSPPTWIDDPVVAKVKMVPSASGFHVVASPLTGGGMPLGRIPQLCLLALQQGLKTPEEWARFAQDLLLALGQRLVKDGQTLEKPEDMFTELVSQARQFAEKELPTLKAMRVA